MHIERADLRAAFKSLEFEKVELKGPEDFVAFVRSAMANYGGADPDRALAGVDVRPVSAGGVAAEYLVPEQVRDEERLVYLHGGAWIAGELNLYRRVGAAMAKAAGRAVLVVDYRLAPENPFPIPLDDCVTAFEWALGHGPGGQGQAPVCVFGDSAGGNLAAALCVRQIQAGRPLPRRLALLCGVLDMSQVDYVARHDPLSGRDSLEASYALYAQGRAAPDDGLISPAQAGEAILSRFPPTLLQASADEFLVEGSRRMADAMSRAGARSLLSIWPLMPHSWHCFLDLLPEAKLALEEVAGFFAARDGATAGG